jgi:hypothetical protein
MCPRHSFAYQLPLLLGISRLFDVASYQCQPLFGTKTPSRMSLYRREKSSPADLMYSSGLSLRHAPDLGSGFLPSPLPPLPLRPPPWGSLAPAWALCGLLASSASLCPPSL